jgi:lipopolysaccharide biosynthesis glycosyltransferase
MELVSSSYNFQEAFLGPLAADATDEILKSVSILHFAGSGRKPWKKRIAPRSKKTMLLWYAYNADARLNTDLFSYGTQKKEEVLEKQS